MGTQLKNLLYNLIGKDTYTIGDSYNDIPLMTYGYNGACMTTALEEVQQNATVLYDSVGTMIYSILD